MERKFKIGDIVALNPTTRGFAALKGAKAKVTGYTEDDYMLINWIDEKRRGQTNGDYCEEDFELAEKKVRIIKEFGIVDFTKQYYK